MSDIEDLVTPEEDAELGKDMKDKIEKDPKKYKPLAYCSKRNPSKRGGNSTSKQPETKDFEQLYKIHDFLGTPRTRWKPQQRHAYSQFLMKIQTKYEKRFEEEWERKQQKQKKEQIKSLVNKKFTSFLARQTKKTKKNKLSKKPKTGSTTSKRIAPKRVAPRSAGLPPRATKKMYLPRPGLLRSVPGTMTNPWSEMRKPIDAIQDFRKLQKELDLPEVDNF